MSFSDYIIFADESGSPNLDGIDPDFPIFVLVFVIVRKETYVNDIVPKLQQLKFDFVGHDQLILHERDIRRQTQGFLFLRRNPQIRTLFIERLNELVAAIEVDVVAAVIDKAALSQRYVTPWDPYDLAMHFCMEKACSLLMRNGQRGRSLHVVFESRGSREDAALELTFRRTANDEAHWGWRRTRFGEISWEPLFVDKKANSSGLQFADLFARPIGLKYLRPDQSNRAFEVIRRKLLFPGIKSFP